MTSLKYDLDLKFSKILAKLPFELKLCIFKLTLLDIKLKYLFHNFISNSHFEDEANLQFNYLINSLLTHFSIFKNCLIIDSSNGGKQPTPDVSAAIKIELTSSDFLKLKTLANKNIFHIKYYYFNNYTNETSWLLDHCQNLVVNDRSRTEELPFKYLKNITELQLNCEKIDNIDLLYVANNLKTIKFQINNNFINDGYSPSLKILLHFLKIKPIRLILSLTLFNNSNLGKILLDFNDFLEEVDKTSVYNSTRQSLKVQIKFLNTFESNFDFDWVINTLKPFSKIVKDLEVDLVSNSITLSKLLKVTKYLRKLKISSLNDSKCEIINTRKPSIASSNSSSSSSLFSYRPCKNSYMLNRLELHGFKLSNNYPILAAFNNLHSLKLIDCNLSIEVLDRLQNLTKLHLHNCHYEDVISLPSNLIDFQFTEDDTQISSSSYSSQVKFYPVMIQNLNYEGVSNLKSLRFKRKSLTNEILSDLPSTLETLVIDECEIKGTLRCQYSEHNSIELPEMLKDLEIHGYCYKSRPLLIGNYENCCKLVQLLEFQTLSKLEKLTVKEGFKNKVLINLPADLPPNLKELNLDISLASFKTIELPSSVKKLIVKLNNFRKDPFIILNKLPNNLEEFEIISKSLYYNLIKTNINKLNLRKFKIKIDLPESQREALVVKLRLNDVPSSLRKIEFKRELSYSSTKVQLYLICNEITENFKKCGLVGKCSMIKELNKTGFFRKKLSL